MNFDFFQILRYSMMARGRPKGAKNKDVLNVENIIPPKVDENANVKHPAPNKSKPTISTRIKTHTNKVCHSLLGTPIQHFNRAKLPQNKAVLRRYLALREERPKEKVDSLVTILYEQMITGIWVPARIFTVSEKSAKNKIKLVINKFLGFKHALSGSRECPEKAAEFSDFLLQLCDLSPTNLYKMLKDTWQMNKEWENDWKFFLSMCEPTQVGRIAGIDMKLAGKENDKQMEVNRVAKQKKKSDTQKRKLQHKVTGEEFEDESLKEQRDIDEDDEVIYTIRRKRKLEHRK